MKNKILLILFYLFIAAILVFSIRGIMGNPTSQNVNQISWTDDGPFELSPERGRFALTLSLVENKSFQFTTPLALFAVPDLGYKNGKFVSLFAPLLSFLILPGYLVGQLFNIGQVGAYAVVALFALVNVILVYSISKKLGANGLAAAIAGAIFLFATPAFAYGVSLYQHHVSTFLILLSIYILVSTEKIWPLIFVWVLVGAAIPLDYPNLLFMLPIMAVSLLRLISTTIKDQSVIIKVRLWGGLTLAGLLLPLLFFFWFNFQSYGSPLAFLSSVAQIKNLNPNGTIVTSTDPQIKSRTEENRSVLIFFNSRLELNGFNILFLSPDRGIVFFAPIVLFGLLGAYILYSQQNKHTALLLGVAGFNFIVYSIWGDVWGGWSFGSRYLLPTYAILSICLAIALTKLRKKLVFVLPLFLVMIYSVSVNSLGALTSSRNPPQVETVALSKLSGRTEKYSLDRNLDFLYANKSKSFVWQTWAAPSLTAMQYYLILNGLIISLLGSMLFWAYFQRFESRL